MPVVALDSYGSRVVRFPIINVVLDQTKQSFVDVNDGPSGGI